MVQINFKVSFLFVTLAVISIHYTEGRKVLITDLKCNDHSEDVCSNLSCNLKENSKKRNLMNLGCDIKESATAMNWNMSMTYKNDKISPVSVSSSYNWCDVVDGNMDGLAVKFMMPLIKMFIPSLSHPCPYKGRIEVKNFDVNEISSMIPPVSPLGDYMIDFVVSDAKGRELIHPTIKMTIKK